MREGSPSLTAMFVAFARAVAHHEPELSRFCHDPVAEKLAPGLFRRLLREARSLPDRADTYTYLRRLSGGLIDHIALRTVVIDRFVREALSHGARQLVVLGAGLDGRAHRMAELADTIVFEVDHPTTQALKQKKARSLPTLAREVRYAACDFHDVSIADALAHVDFRPEAPSIWLWEGVTMYLPEAAVLHSLESVAALSAPESTLILTYLTPEVTQGPRLLARAGSAVLSAISEPVRFAVHPETMRQRLESHGYTVSADVSPSASAREYGARIPRLSVVLPSERVATARKTRRVSSSHA